MKERVLTSLALAPVVLGAFFSTHTWPALFLLVLVLVLSLVEIANLIKASSLGLLVLGVLFFAGGLVLTQGHAEFLALLACVPLICGLLCAWAAVKQGDIILKLFSVGWVVGPVLSIYALWQIGRHEHEAWSFTTPILIVFLSIWAGDIAAIFAGKAFGKRLLAPTISPKKTWEGSIANALASTLVAGITAVILGYDLAFGLVFGFVGGIAGQFGDLFESWIKRQANVKDSGTLLPGHGGILDRIDSLLLAAPVAAVLLSIWPKK